MDWQELLGTAVAGALLALGELLRRKLNRIHTDVRNGSCAQTKDPPRSEKDRL